MTTLTITHLNIPHDLGMFLEFNSTFLKDLTPFISFNLFLYCSILSDVLQVIHLIPKLVVDMH